MGPRKLVCSGMPIEVLAPQDLAGRAAQYMARLLRNRIAERGSCSVAFSGGGTPAAMFDALTRPKIDWAQVEVFQVDERMVPPEHPERNFAGLRRHLLDKVGCDGGRIHPMPTQDRDPQHAAASYGAVLHARAAGGLDVVHLGLGDDGHTASWPPGDPVIDSPESVAIAGPYRGHLRMTLTPRTVRRADTIVWLVAGAGKAEQLRRLVEADPAIPASHARRSGDLILADEPAARLL